jgi:hypothetical protein
MLNVRPINSTPGFRVGLDDDELGFNIAEPNTFYEDAWSSTPRFDLAANPYLRIAQDRLTTSGWGGPSLPSASLLGSGMAAPAAPSAPQSTPQPTRFAGEGSQSPSAVDATEELCHGVGRSGPYCLYRCPSGQWIYTPQYPSGPCPPFHFKGIGTFPWGV